MTTARINTAIADLIKAIEELEQAEMDEERADCEPECELDEIESDFIEKANRMFVLLAEAEENHHCPFLLERARSYGRKLSTTIKKLTGA